MKVLNGIDLRPLNAFYRVLTRKRIGSYRLGSAGLTFTTLAILTPRSPMVGAAPLTSTVTGVTFGRGKMVASAASVFTDTAIIWDASQVLNASITIRFIPLPVSSGRGVMTGTSALSFAINRAYVNSDRYIGVPLRSGFNVWGKTVGAVLSSSPAFQGLVATNALSFGVTTADLTSANAGTLIASTTMTFYFQPQPLQAKGHMAALAPLAFTQTGTAINTATSNIAGNAALAFTQVANGLRTAFIASTVPLTITTSAQLEAGAMIGTAAMVFSSVANDTFKHAIYGTAGLAFTDVANGSTYALSLVTNTPLTFATSSNVVGIGRRVGSTGLAFTSAATIRFFDAENVVAIGQRGSSDAHRVQVAARQGRGRITSRKGRRRA